MTGGTADVTGGSAHRAAGERDDADRARPDPLPPVDEQTAAALASFRQGDVLPQVPALSVIGPDGQPALVPTPDGAVVVAQTCDAVQPDRLTVHLAPLVRLTDATTAAEARDGRRPRYVHLPEAGDDAFADLEIVSSVAKAHVASHPHTPGVAHDADVRRFGLAVGRKYSRYAFPDDVVPWLQPLEAIVLSKSNKPHSPEGQALADVMQLRLEVVGSWAEPPFDLILAVILHPGVLPTFPNDALPDLPETLATALYGQRGELRETSSQIAEKLAKAVDPVERYFLWMALGDAWAARCRPKPAAPPSVHAAVNSLIAEVVPADEFNLLRVGRSEVLDLDHLSPPPPG